MATVSCLSPNKALQRTPPASPLAPLSFQTLGDTKLLGGGQALLALCISLAGCANALPTYNQPFQERLSVISSAPSNLSILIEGGEQAAVPVPRDGRMILNFPVLPRECSTYLFGIMVADRSVEARPIIHFMKDGRLIRRMSVNSLRASPVDSGGFHEVRIR